MFAHAVGRGVEGAARYVAARLLRRRLRAEHERGERGGKYSCDFQRSAQRLSPSASIFANSSRAGKRGRAHTYTRVRPRAFPHLAIKALTRSELFELFEPFAHAYAPRKQRDVARAFEQLEPRARHARRHQTRGPRAIEQAVGRARDDERGRLYLRKARAQIG